MQFTHLSLEVRSDFRRNLTIRHAVRGFTANDTLTEGLALKLFLKLTLRLTGAKYQNSVCITKTGDDLVIIFAETVIETSVLSVSPDLGGIIM
jgi:hypothetical protein